MAKHVRRILIIVALVMLMVAGNILAKAYERKGHDNLTSVVLFKNYKFNVEYDEKTKQEFEVLTSALYITIDQFNNNGQTDLDKLIKYGVKKIPENVNDELIHISAGPSTHRNYTHRGWDFVYPTEQGRKIWENRKNILVKTVDKVFDFDGDNKKRDSFCALLYYIHIIGDHKDDKSYKVNNGLKMRLGGSHDKDNIIDELINHIEVLFSDQRKTEKYSSLIRYLKKYEKKYDTIYYSKGGIDSEEKFEKRTKILNEIVKCLSLYIPGLLRDEAFFKEVFYD